MRREEIEALAVDYDAAANRCEEIAAREDAGGWPTAAAHHRSEAGAIKWAAHMLREALAKSDAARGPVIDSAALDAEIGPCDVCGRAASLCQCDS